MRFICLIIALAATCAAGAEDWPTYRHDAARTGVTAEELPRDLQLQWVRELPAPEPAWPDQQRLQFDVAYEPIVADGKLFISSARSLSVTAYDAATGQEIWRFCANGPVRFAPTVANGKVYAVADDGFLYCLKSADGALLWKFNGAPTNAERWVLGNGRLISTWCARGAPVVADGKVYFAAGIWPMMGVFVYALDAETAALLWANDSLGTIFVPQPHHTRAFSGLAPQGYLAVGGDKLIVPGGRSVPAVLERATGKLLWFNMLDYGVCGGFDVSVGDGYFCNNFMLFDFETGSGGYFRNWYGTRYFPAPLIDGSTFISNANWDPAVYTVVMDEVTDAKGKKRRQPVPTAGTRVHTGGVVHVKAGALLIGGGEKTLVAATMPAAPEKPQVAWQKTIDGTVASLAVANGRLYASTLDGRIYCFGAGKVEPKTWPRLISIKDREVSAEAVAVRAAAPVSDGICLVFGSETTWFLEDLYAGTRLHVIDLEPDAAKCLRLREAVDGLGDAAIDLVSTDPRTSWISPYVADLVVSEKGLRTPEEIAAAYRTLRPYGGIAVLKLPLAEAREAVKAAKIEGGALKTAGGHTLLIREGPPPGSADWTHQNANPSNTLVGEDRNITPPMGLLWFGGVSNEATLPRHGHGPMPLVAGGRLFIEGPDSISARDVYTGRPLWRRDFPGIGDAFTNTDHQPGANSLGSNFVAIPDSVYVRRPKSILRLDAATGRTLGEFKLPTVPGREDEPSLGYLAVSGNVLLAVAEPLTWDWDADFTAWQFKGVLDKDIPALVAAVARWRGYPKVVRESVADDREFLIANLNALISERDLVDRLPADFRATQEAGRLAPLKLLPAKAKLETYLRKNPLPAPIDRRLREINREVLQGYYLGLLPFVARGKPGDFNYDYSAGSELVAMDRASGDVLWTRAAKLAFRSNAVSVGADKVFVVDRLPKNVSEMLHKWNEAPAEAPALLALDLSTGREMWRKADGVFGTWLSYSAAHDALVESCRMSRDMLYDEDPRSLRVYKGASGDVLWQKDCRYEGPVLLLGDSIVTQDSEGNMGNAAFSILTGDCLQFKHPLTGVERPWRMFKNYGCGTAIAAPGMILFRSDAAGYQDFATFGGTGNFGGFKSGCTPSLIPADGILNAPDYTRTCVCGYQNQASLGLIHDPDVEAWTWNDYRLGDGRVRRLGINLGAPGDRLDESGTMWLEYPSVGGPSPRVDIATQPESVEWFYRHSLRMKGAGLKWVAASGARGLSSLAVTLLADAEDTKPYVVRLHFSEPDGLAAGERLFDVSLQGRKVLADFDVSREAGGPDRAVVREFKGIAVRDVLTIALAPSVASKKKETILCGVEIVADGW